MTTSVPTSKSLRRSGRRGAVIVHVAVGSTVFIAVAALAVDVGMLYSVKTDLQTAADAAALAGVSGYFTNEGLIQNHAALAATVEGRTKSYGLANETFNAGGTVVANADITLGRFDFANRLAPLDTSGAQRFNAVRVTTRRSADGPNGSVLFYFSRIFGMAEGGVTASAIAAMDDRVVGIDATSMPSLIPFTIHIDIYNDQLVNGSDNYSYDDGVLSSGDDVPEIKLFPYKLSGNGNGNDGNDGSGNFGLLEFGGSGANQARDNIAEGINPEDLEAQTGTTTLTYVDEDGNATSYWLTGEPGLKAGVESAIEDRIGDVVSFFLHDDVTGNGANTQYNNVAIRVGRIMHVDLHGSPKNKALVIQPVAYNGSGVIVGATGQSTDGQMGRMMLVK